MRSAPVVVGLLALLSACGVGQGGIGLPHQRDRESYPGDRKQLSGVLEVAGNGRQAAG